MKEKCATIHFERHMQATFQLLNSVTDTVKLIFYDRLFYLLLTDK